MPAAVLDALVTVFPAVEPAFPTVLAAVGLEPDRPDATEPAACPTLEPTFWPVLETTCDTVPPGF